MIHGEGRGDERIFSIKNLEMRFHGTVSSRLVCPDLWTSGNFYSNVQLCMVTMYCSRNAIAQCSALES